jgi:hypothetical protein
VVAGGLRRLRGWWDGGFGLRFGGLRVAMSRMVEDTSFGTCLSMDEESVEMRCSTFSSCWVWC